MYVMYILLAPMQNLNEKLRFIGHRLAVGEKHAYTPQNIFFYILKILTNYITIISFFLFRLGISSSTSSADVTCMAIATYIDTWNYTGVLM
jgi:hypothetical protein